MPDIARRATAGAALRFILFFSLFPVSAHATRDLLVANPATNSILRFDGQTGAPKGNFVAPGAGGLISPRQMQQGPEGALYVAAFDSNNIIRYSMTDGSSIGNFLPTGEIFCPTSLEFLPGGKVFIAGRPGSCGTSRVVKGYDLQGVAVSPTITTTASRLGLSRDFLTIPGGDFLFISSVNTGSRFSGLDGSYISYFLNPTASISILNNPGGILFGPDGNLWVSSKGLNRVTRFDPNTGAKIDDIISGGLLNNGPNEMRIEGNWLYIAGGNANNIVRYNLSNLATINSSGEVFVPDTAGLSNPEHIVFLDINDLPVARAGADATVVAGQPFTLDGSASSDPENVPLAFTWTQLSGTPVSGLPAATASVPLTAPPAPSVLVFQLSVSDGVRSATDTVQITVTAPDAQLEAPENTVLADGSGALAFGTVALGQNAALSVIVRNTGNAPLIATTPDFTGAHGSDFSYDPTGFDPTLDPGQSSTFTLRFIPSTAGGRFATFRFRSNDPDEDPYEIALSGTGNTPPTYPGFSAVAAHNTPLVLSRNKLTAFASDADADAVTLTAVSPTSAESGSVVLAPATVTYTPPNNFSGSDSFTFTLTDARGATATGTVSLTVDPPDFSGGTGSNPAQITVRGDGKVDVKFQGIPNRNYRIQRSINMTAWDNIGQTTASPTGQVTYLDENPPVPNGFYRIARF